MYHPRLWLKTRPIGWLHCHIIVSSPWWHSLGSGQDTRQKYGLDQDHYRCPARILRKYKPKLCFASSEIEFAFPEQGLRVDLRCRRQKDTVRTRWRDRS